MSNICFIPARNSSTRLKNKAISKFGKGNLVTHTVNQAIESGIFDRIILSSNDEGILRMARDKVETHLRDDKYDQLIGVVQQAIPEFELYDNDIFYILLVTCPLRERKDIISAYNLFNVFDGYHPVVSVKKNENPIQMSFKADAGGHLEPVMPDDFYRSTRKQDHDDTYYFNDAIIIDTVERFMRKGRTLYGELPIPYLMPWERSIAIDYEFQLRICQCLEDKKCLNLGE